MVAAGRMADKNRLCVVGASNMDLIAYVPRFPAPGETLKGHKFQQGYGGKGANQAVAAALYGGNVVFVAKVGDDLFGEGMKRNLKEKGIDITYVGTEEGVASGVAPIFVEDSGENCIVICGGANDLLKKADLVLAKEAIATCSHLLCQLEIDVTVTAEALCMGAEASVYTILNTAPACALSDEIIGDCSMIIANETEIFQMQGDEVKESPSESQIFACSARLFRTGTRLECVIVTLGAKGCLVIIKESTHSVASSDREVFEKVEDHAELLYTKIPAMKVDKVVDTTGAGDCFVGVLGASLAEKKSLVEAVREAVHASGQSVQKEGTQSSYPTKSVQR